MNEEREFRETVGIQTAGSLLGERFLRFDLGARWGLSQERAFERDRDRELKQSPDGKLLEYDFRLDALPAGKLSTSFFGSQLEDRVPRQFLPSLDRTRERYGATLLYNDRALPMRLSYEHTFDDIHGGRDRLDDEQFGRDALNYEATWQIEEHHSLRLEYEYEDQEERFSGLQTQFNTRRHDVTLDHALRFGRDREHSLDTLVRLQDEAGDLARDTLELAPRLRLQHTPQLATTYGGQYLEETLQDSRLRQWRGDVGLIHQSDPLTSTFNLYALRQDAEDLAGRGGGSDAADWGGTASFAYARENPFGRFHANLSYSHNRVRTADDRSSGIVLSETATFRDPLPVFLAQDHVIPLSILVWDPTRRRVFVAGQDYVAVRFGRITALQRVRTGRIQDGDSVTVSYRYRWAHDFELTRDRLDLRLQQDFTFGLSAYYAGSVQDEDLSRARFQTFGARNVNRHRLGLSYRQPRWSLAGEAELNDETIDPFSAVHVNGDLTLLEDARQQLSGRTRVSRFWFDGSGQSLERATTLLDAGLSYRYLLAPRLEANASAAYRYETDSLFGRTNGVDVTGSLAYKIGLFSVLFELEYDVLDLPGSNDNTLAVWLKLRRNVPVVGQPRGQG